jgi:hypothetical protein
VTHDPDRTPNPTFPRLTPLNHKITSPAVDGYNCIAWAVGDVVRWWEPGYFWPVPVIGPKYALANLVRAYESVGFTGCNADQADASAELVALYSDGNDRYTHAARRLPSGKWTSKLGQWEDIEHDTPDDVAGGAYGEVVGYMSRPRA